MEPKHSLHSTFLPSDNVSAMFSRGQLHQQCCEEWTLVSEETQAKMARMAAAAAWGLGKHTDTRDLPDRKTPLIAGCVVLTDLCSEHVSSSGVFVWGSWRGT